MQILHYNIVKNAKTMRKRIKRTIFAGSSSLNNIVEWKKELEENHVRNSNLFMTIHQTVQVKPKTSLELFEEGLKKKIAEFKQNNRKNI